MGIRTFEKKLTINERCKGNHRRKANCFIGEYITSWIRFCITFENVL